SIQDDWGLNALTFEKRWNILHKLDPRYGKERTLAVFSVLGLPSNHLTQEQQKMIVTRSAAILADVAAKDFSGDFASVLLYSATKTGMSKELGESFLKSIFDSVASRESFSALFYGMLFGVKEEDYYLNALRVNGETQLGQILDNIFEQA